MLLPRRAQDEIEGYPLLPVHTGGLRRQYYKTKSQPQNDFLYPNADKAVRSVGAVGDCNVDMDRRCLHGQGGRISFHGIVGCSLTHSHTHMRAVSLVAFNFLPSLLSGAQINVSRNDQT